MSVGLGRCCGGIDSSPPRAPWGLWGAQSRGGGIAGPDTRRNDKLLHFWEPMETQHLPRSPSKRPVWRAGPNRAGAEPRAHQKHLPGRGERSGYPRFGGSRSPVSKGWRSRERSLARKCDNHNFLLLRAARVTKQKSLVKNRRDLAVTGPGRRILQSSVPFSAPSHAIPPPAPLNPWKSPQYPLPQQPGHALGVEISPVHTSF